MKISKLIVMAAAFLTVGCASTFAKAKVKENKIVVQRLDWQGSTTGRDVPDWVDHVVDGDAQIVAKELKIDPKQYKAFVVSLSIPNTSAICAAVSLLFIVLLLEYFSNCFKLCFESSET